MSNANRLRAAISANRLADEGSVLAALADFAPAPDLRTRAAARAVEMVRRLRADDSKGLMEIFLAEYGLSSSEGVALMCLAEALLRVPDAPTMDALIEDKIVPGAWGKHLGHSASSLVNASTWALLLTGSVLREEGEPSLAGVLRGAVKRVGEPVIRAAVGRAMKELGRQFVLGETIEAAVARGAEDRDVTHSFDMLGEAAMTAADAQAYFDAYAHAIAVLGQNRRATINDSPGISIKLSALHPRYEVAQRDRVIDELVPRVLQLAGAAAQAGIGLAIDAEEADRLELSLDVIGAVLRDPVTKNWDGFGVVVQAYGQRAGAVIDWLEDQAQTRQRKMTLRLVKGAYWDTEIKRAQVDGLAGFPVFTRKPATDAHYLCLANRLLQGSGHIFPQFATHNAHTMATIATMAPDPDAFEFQRLHGMGEALHRMVARDHGTRHRVYAPVGAHRDLLAYLVRRLLENGANSSFVHQILDPAVAPEAAAQDPFEALAHAGAQAPRGVVMPTDLFMPERRNSLGWDLRAEDDLAALDAARGRFRDHQWSARPLLAVASEPGAATRVLSPATPKDLVGLVHFASADTTNAAVRAARRWDAPAAERAAVLARAADLYEQHHGELFALLAREAGKTLPDAVAELREAVDFLRYYGAQALSLTAPARGVIGAISPWNFPLAIFTGQVCAALAAGNGVIAKPAESTTLIAMRAVELLHEAGVPRAALQFLPGTGSVVGAAMSAAPDLHGVVFTGSTATAQRINRTMASAMAPEAMLIAETGGLNAMIVDSTALPEQAVRDIVTSGFQSAGQRCSALRMLYIQEEIFETVTEMLMGAMDELRLGDPWELATDVGPVIDANAKAGIEAHIAACGDRIFHRTGRDPGELFVRPTLIRVEGIGDMNEEIFGPVVHVAPFRAEDLGRVVDEINASGFGLTFGLHSRIDARVGEVAPRIRAGNIYVNRNQIGAIVGSQPFGGEGLSGTGPKAGGPEYLWRMTKPKLPGIGALPAKSADPAVVQAAIDAAGELPDGGPALDLPGPTGESNRYRQVGRGVVLCLGPTASAARAQAAEVRRAGALPIPVAPGLGAQEGVDGLLAPDDLQGLSGVDLVADWSDAPRLRAIREALAAREGAIILLAAGDDLRRLSMVERHLSIDTTAAGGNARLLAATT